MSVAFFKGRPAAAWPEAASAAKNPPTLLTRDRCAPILVLAGANLAGYNINRKAVF